ncbi:MAG: O-acetyl-ADP-ribose deacetylase [Planctomycetales bacterium]|nr:O-acetyl-ADP-ribose deacetylase [Planctomycetales bacterium]
MKISDRIKVVQGDITELDVDCIVTAANSALLGGGGVDGAVHRAAGAELVKASSQLAPCPAGQARITPGFNLAAKFVIHAVGPIFSELNRDSQVLAATYESALLLANEHKVVRIAFPCISTGVYGFPKPEACEVAIATVIDWMRQHADRKIVIFCCFDDEDVSLYRHRLLELGAID